MIIAPPADTKRPVVEPKSFPAPLGGINTAAPVTATPDGACLQLNNFTARTDGLHVREGSVVVQDSLGGPVVTLMPYPGHVVAGLSASGLAWSWAHLTNGAGVFLCAVNGVDGYRVYNGNGWLPISFDNLDPTLVSTIAHHQSRLWFGATNTLDVYYLPLDAYAGAVCKLPHNHLCKRGGAIAAIASLTQDGGRNSGDQLLVVTTNGEIVIWNGADPSKPETWSLAGVWTAPPPVGRRCLIGYGGAIAYLSTKGLLPLPAVLAREDEEKPLSAYTEPIWPTYDKAIQSGDWHMADSDTHDVLVLHGPTGQFVRSGTGAWSTWSVPNATSWLQHQGELYFGTSDGKICKMGGNSDNGVPIDAFLASRFETLGSPNIKHSVQVRPFYISGQNYVPRMSIETNWRDIVPFTASAINGTDLMWPDMSYGRMPMAWTRPLTARVGPWRSVQGSGVGVSLMMAVRSRGPFVLTGWDMQVEAGGSQ